MHNIIFPRLELNSMTDHHIAMTVSPSIQSLCCHRTSLSVLKASGKNIREYLQGQITQDIKLLTPEKSIYTAVLTPQGKMLGDMHIIDQGNELIMLTSSSHAIALVERLRRFALGHDIRLGCVETLAVLSIQGEGAEKVTQNIQQNIEASMSMPEAAPLGTWLVMNNTDIQSALNTIPNTCNNDDMEKAAIIHGSPRFGRDWSVSVHPLNANLIEMNGVSFDKGCYVGQEVTSRMHWRGGIKKKLYRVQIHGELPAAPCPIQSHQHNIATLSSAATNALGEHFGIAHFPIEVVENNNTLMLKNGATLSVLEPCHA